MQPDDRFPKASLVHLKFVRRMRYWTFRYTRIANAGMLVVGPVVVIFRMPWLPMAAYAKGWDAHWRQSYEHEK